MKRPEIIGPALEFSVGNKDSVGHPARINLYGVLARTIAPLYSYPEILCDGESKEHRLMYLAEKCSVPYDVQFVAYIASINCKAGTLK